MMKISIWSRRWARIAIAAVLAVLLLAPARLLAVPALAAPSTSITPSLQTVPLALSQRTVTAQINADDESSGKGTVDVYAEAPGDAADAPLAAPQEDTPQPAEAEPQEGGVETRVTSSSRGGTRHTAQSAGELIVGIASQYLGAPYRWSGTSPSGFDCSGFTWFVYGQAGFPVPRDLGGQLDVGPSIDMDNLQPGDLLIFENTYERGLSHSGVYIGDGQFIDSQDERHGVVVNSFDEWARHFAGASRPWAR